MTDESNSPSRKVGGRLPDVQVGIYLINQNVNTVKRYRDVRLSDVRQACSDVSLCKIQSVMRPYQMVKGQLLATVNVRAEDPAAKAKALAKRNSIAEKFLVFGGKLGCSLALEWVIDGVFIPSPSPMRAQFERAQVT
jgi:hypothetical protein